VSRPLTCPFRGPGPRAGPLRSDPAPGRPSAAGWGRPHEKNTPTCPPPRITNAAQSVRLHACPPLPPARRPGTRSRPLAGETPARVVGESAGPIRRTKSANPPTDPHPPTITITKPSGADVELAERPGLTAHMKQQQRRTGITRLDWPTAPATTGLSLLHVNGPSPPTAQGRRWNPLPSKPSRTLRKDNTRVLCPPAPGQHPKVQRSTRVHDTRNLASHSLTRSSNSATWGTDPVGEAERSGPRRAPRNGSVARISISNPPAPRANVRIPARQRPGSRGVTPSGHRPSKRASKSRPPCPALVRLTIKLGVRPASDSCCRAQQRHDRRCVQAVRGKPGTTPPPARAPGHAPRLAGG